MQEYYEIKNLNKYQPSYKDGRKLIWIRWYIDSLNDYKFTKLNPAQKWLFIGLSMLQVKEQGRIPKDHDWICLQLQYEKKHIDNDLNMLHEIDLLVTKCDEMSQKNAPIRGEERRGDKIREDILSCNHDLKAPIVYLNEKTKRNYSPTNKSTQDLIRARYNEGRTLADFKTVIDRKCAQWLTDDKMVNYLRPSTLFNRTNFENYLNEKEKFILPSKIQNKPYDPTKHYTENFKEPTDEQLQDIHELVKTTVKTLENKI